MDQILLAHAKKIHPEIRKHILDEQLIDKAVNTDQQGTPMEYLFDVYEEFIDLAAEHDDWTCGMCRAAVLLAWQKLKPYLVHLQNATKQ